MPKSITSEMIQGMSLAQRKTLHQNALDRDTPASRAVLDLLSRDDLMGKATPTKTPVRKSTTPRQRAGSTTPKSVRAVHGRQV